MKRVLTAVPLNAPAGTQPRALPAHETQNVVCTMCFAARALCARHQAEQERDELRVEFRRLWAEHERLKKQVARLKARRTTRR